MTIDVLPLDFRISAMAQYPSIIAATSEEEQRLSWE